ncbi:hypothetical protein [Dethiobacter alkaliphilus]|uniref:Uncharacterized protein n=1 Tax=Dethiobacter alkaliphilus AHT 1 TaxID=555088 RepID=C0GG68_DETAL|nr:hypothetical protein [Dethiobacter alkaliphilus]EEG77757.1 hypothetical protein DealDRAFT_1477 [Dethiobacter alkaliphilus AHT 1]MCW3491127.1 hypothetical protein [Dethiobacter alkaliphilus]
MHHTKDHAQFASLSDKDLNKIREAEKFLNSQPDHSSEEIILLAYKQPQPHR